MIIPFFFLHAIVFCYVFICIVVVVFFRQDFMTMSDLIDFTTFFRHSAFFASSFCCCWCFSSLFSLHSTGTSNRTNLLVSWELNIKFNNNCVKQIVADFFSSLDWFVALHLMHGLTTTSKNLTHHATQSTHAIFFRLCYFIETTNFARLRHWETSVKLLLMFCSVFFSSVHCILLNASKQEMHNENTRTFHIEQKMITNLIILKWLL